MTKIAIYPGTFDPITFGHVDLITKGLKVVDKIIVAISNIINIEHLFSVEERIASGYWNIGQNGRFKLYPTGNMYNFIMVDVIDGRTWQVQWHIDEAKRLVIRFY